MNYCGIDVHSNNCVVIVSDESDRIVYRKRLPNEFTQIAAALEPYRHELAGVVVESTYNWYWLVHCVIELAPHLCSDIGHGKNESDGYRTRTTSVCCAQPDGTRSGRATRKVDPDARGRRIARQHHAHTLL
ncbi:hypothetical protein M3I54_40800 [Paraburkholderia sp. CNPSo 3274]|uniref:hypothetical protein n=1 Tax=Paraburkholderia sp. CNPSo 3274 TaxID=2940932 RepID=UPI0020B8FA54|nr:hypothetical protein [Paraburkholderia sp. CNPSo 3274]MCP3713145.1 hypothetical protein [Paraburkholderia sp. CNPSo 3274]